MSNTFKIILLVIAAGIFAIVARAMYVRAAHPVAAVEAPAKMVRSAAADLPEGLLLRDSDFVWHKVEDETVPAGAIFKDTETSEIKGALLRHALPKDAIITAGDVIVASDPGFLAATLQPDMRAVSVAIDDVSGNAGLIQPGDFIDLLLTQDGAHQDSNSSRDQSITSETVAQRVRVLAVGSQIQRPKSGKDVDPRANARTVTLEVTPHRAEVIAVAAKLGSLSLALRSFARAAVVPGASEAADDAPPPVYAGDITHVARMQRAAAPATAAIAAAPRAAPVDAPVQVFRGSNKAASLVTADTSGSNWNAGVPPLPPMVSDNAPRPPTIVRNPQAYAAPETQAANGDLVVAQ